MAEMQLSASQSWTNHSSSASCPVDHLRRGGDAERGMEKLLRVVGMGWAVQV
jgi:hypothetical protein